jgi:NADP-dependent 3-hydroxy acid dehydrogenase YdfG
MGSSEQVALVTGASSGIGEATARALSREGYAVVLAARREDRLEAIVDEMGDEKALAVPTDVTDGDDITALVDRTLDAFDRIDVLVNNAGVLRRGPVASADRSDVRQQVEVNLLGLMNVTRAVLPLMLASGGGDIVAISSANARYPAKGSGPYTATKTGVNGFCEALREEVADDGVRVTVVMPGVVDTEMQGTETFEREVLSPADVADTVTFALSRPDNALLAELLVAASPPVPYR